MVWFWNPTVEWVKSMGAVLDLNVVKAILFVSCVTLGKLT